MFVERKFFLNRNKELESQSENEFVDQVLVLAQNHKLKRRGSTIVHDAIGAAEVPESEIQTQPAYPVRQLEQVVFYSQPQNTQQTPEPFRGVRDVLLSAPSGMQKRVAVPISNLSLYPPQNQVHQNFNLLVSSLGPQSNFPLLLLILHIFSCFFKLFMFFVKSKKSNFMCLVAAK